MVVDLNGLADDPDLIEAGSQILVLDLQHLTHNRRREDADDDGILDLQSVIPGSGVERHLKRVGGRLPVKVYAHLSRRRLDALLLFVGLYEVAARQHPADIDLSCRVRPHLRYELEGQELPENRTDLDRRTLNRRPIGQRNLYDELRLRHQFYDYLLRLRHTAPPRVSLRIYGEIKPPVSVRHLTDVGVGSARLEPVIGGELRGGIRRYRCARGEILHRDRTLARRLSDVLHAIHDVNGFSFGVFALNGLYLP